jgi:hypothetical protein
LDSKQEQLEAVRKQFLTQAKTSADQLEASLKTNRERQDEIETLVAQLKESTLMTVTVKQDCETALQELRDEKKQMEEMHMQQFTLLTGTV